MASASLERMRRLRSQSTARSKKKKPTALAVSNRDDRAERLRQALHLFFHDEKGTATRLAYKRRLAVFAKWLDPEQWGGCHEIGCLEEAAEYAAKRFLSLGSTEAHSLVLAWKEEMLAAGSSTATVGQRLSALRSLAAAAKASEVINWELQVKSPKRKSATRDVRGPRPEAVELLLKHCGPDGDGPRNEALVRLLCTAGLTREEVTKLQVKHFDRDGRRLWVQGKGGYNVWLDLSQMENCVASLEAWIDGAQLEPEAFLIHRPGRPTKQLSLSGINFIVHELGVAVGVKAWPHAFRHYAGTQMARQTKNAFVVRKAMRHRSIQTTQGYIDSVDDQAAEAMGALDKQLPRRQ
jgi:integrase